MSIFGDFRNWAANEISSPLADLMTVVDSLQAKLEANEAIVSEDIDQLQDSAVAVVGRLFGEDWYWSDEDHCIGIGDDDD